MSKSLKTIQVLSKIGKILSQIVFICCIVGFCGCVVGIISLSIGAKEVLHVAGVNIHGIIETSVGMSDGALYASMAIGMIATAGEAVIAGFAKQYFKNELAVGTPFTFGGADELKRLGILAIAISCGVSVVCAIVQGVAGEMTELEMGDGASIGLGILFIILSVIFRYGAEIAEANNSHAGDE